MPCDRTEEFLLFAARARNDSSAGAGAGGKKGGNLWASQPTSSSSTTSTAADTSHDLLQQNDFLEERREHLRSRLHAADNSFNAAAAEFDELLQRTHAKLQELARLARQRSIYSDRTAQIQELTYDVKRAITTLNGKIETLERKARETCSNSSSSSQAWQHCNTLIEMLKCRLLDLTKNFKDVLLLRTENLKRQEERRNLYSYTGALNYKSESDDIERGEQQQLTAQRGHASAYAQSRAEAVENVQRVIGELATIFQRVAAMISHQDEMIQRIDQNIGTSLHNVRQGQTELLNYFQRLSSNRSLIIKVFAILFAFIIFFVFFLS